jgi:hypothetical protein
VESRNDHLTLRGYVVSEMHMARRKCEQKFVVCWPCMLSRKISLHTGKTEQ